MATATKRNTRLLRFPDDDDDDPGSAPAPARIWPFNPPSPRESAILVEMRQRVLEFAEVAC